MPITVICPSCARTFRVSDRFARHRSLCPDCQAVVTIPDEPELLDPVPDDWYREANDRPRRRRSRLRRPDPRDHLPAWRRVSVGFLVQQGATALVLLGLVLTLLGTVLLAEDPGDWNAEPTTAQVVTACLGMLAVFVGFAAQAVGRLLSAATPVRAPRPLGYMSAIASVLAVLGCCLLGCLLGAATAEAGPGGAPDEAVATLAGLFMFAWMFLVAGGESLHGFAIGSVGRVLRADGARILGNGLGVFVGGAGLLAVFVFCGLSAWIGNNGPDAEPNQEQTAALIGWSVAVGVLTVLYLLLDLVQLHLGRAAIARIASDADETNRDGGEDRWD